MALVLCVDVGSTFTKGALVDTERAEPLLATAQSPTTSAGDVLEGVERVRSQLLAEGAPPPDEVLGCSSAGGGLRLAVVGYERDVTAEAGRRVALSAGGRVVHVAAGPLDRAGTAALRDARPDLVLLVGGTDGGNAEVLCHNAARLATARLRTPVVVAGNAAAAHDVAAELAGTGRRFVVTANVLPRIGVVDPEPARGAIRAAFLEHVIGGKGLSRGPAFSRLVRAATPDAVLEGVAVLADAVEGDVLVVDIGGATTDVYSAVRPEARGHVRCAGANTAPGRDVVAQLRHSRTVEADLGLRWSAEGVVEAARREAVALPEGTSRYAGRLASSPAHLPSGPGERALDVALARACAVVAVRRHARPATPGDSPRPLSDVTLVVGSGGVLRHATPSERAHVLEAVTRDHAGGWRVPRDARVATDTAYVLFAAGLLADRHPGAARALAGSVVGAPS